MPPAEDDLSISDSASLLRVVLPRWVVTRDGRERPTSDSLQDSNFENSCFVEEEFPVERLQALFPGKKIARIPASVVRQAGFFIERRPGEAPAGCAVPGAHVVIGPRSEIGRGAYERAARSIVKHQAVSVIAPA
jgi:hypothetical protein